MSDTQETPPEMAAMEMQDVETAVEDVKPAGVGLVKVPSALPTGAKLAHLLALFVSGVIALCVSSVLADGTSVIILKPVKDLPRITNPLLREKGLDYRADELLGPTYGVGLHHDQAGYTWTETGAQDTLANLIDNLGLAAVIAAVPSVISTDGLKHPVHFLSCDELEKAGLAAMSFGFIAEVVAVLMILFHGLALTGLLPISSKLGKMLAGLVWFVLSTGFLVVILLAIAVYTKEWTCHQQIIPSIKLSDHFDYNYGFGFAVIGFFSSLLILCTTLVFTSTDDGAPTLQLVPQADTGASAALVMGIVKTLGGVFCGILIAGMLIILTLYGSSTSEGSDVYAPVAGANPCEGQKPLHAGPGDNYFSNVDCFKDNIVQTLEQAGADVTAGYVGGLDAADRVPITQPYSEVGLCPVNVHWHLGAEHRSAGEFDEEGAGPETEASSGDSSSSSSSSSSADYDDDMRRLAADARLGLRCHHYDATDAKFTTPYTWEHCTGMVVGETYEIHWPHSAAGACGTEWQMQSPFYDGVFCHDGIITIAPLNTYEKIGVQAQVFTVVNDEDYYYSNLIDGMIVNSGEEKGTDMAMYTGSTTGTSRDNDVCSRYTPITWQVDRKCHMISASSFDKLCADMLTQSDDMSSDIYPHGSRELVATHLAANNQQTRK